MSKIGQREITIPDNVKIEEKDMELIVSGPKGELGLAIPKRTTLEIKDGILKVKRANDSKQAKAYHGLYRKLIANMIEGVSDGFTKKLDFKGVGFKAEVQGNKIILNVGFSHPVEYITKEGVELKVEKNIITVSGIDRQKVGQVAADIRAIKPVEPYKGKGIKYIDEIPRRKPGKAAKATVGGAK